MGEQIGGEPRPDSQRPTWVPPFLFKAITHVTPLSPSFTIKKDPTTFFAGDDRENNDLIAYVRFRFRAYNTAEIFGVYIKEDQRIEEHNVDILRWRRREVFK